MRSTDERMKLVNQRLQEKRKAAGVRYEKLCFSLCGTLCLCLVLAAALFAAEKTALFAAVSARFSHTASIFTGGHFFEYAVVGILAFLLGISFTVLCYMIHHKNKEGRTHDGTHR